ncbi:MAG: acylphosphatase [Candidatus Lokiarchaeota archaeon]|nr:acylphosphatase [Candidatus Lokiarchaeota archaeon]
MERIVIDVEGRVQGVFFRHSTKKRAKKMGLKGYAENLSDGSVHIEAQGPKENLEKLLDFVKDGPRLARVDEFNYEYKEPVDNFNSHRYSF